MGAIRRRQLNAIRRSPGSGLFIFIGVRPLAWLLGQTVPI